MSFKCPDCGASLTDDSRFCKYCGAKILDENKQKIEVSGTINQNINHRFNFNSDAKIRKIEAKKEIEIEKAKQALLLEQEERKTKEADHRHFMNQMKLLAIILGVCFLLIILSGLFK